MTSPQTNYYNFPPFSPPPHYFSPPPPPAAKPPSHSTPPPPPHVKPPPLPPHVNSPPPPHVFPPPPSPSPDNSPTVTVIVFVSLGCLFFLAFLCVALCCFLQKKKKKIIEKTDIIRVDEHLKVKEAIVPGPRGEQAVVLLVDDDVHIQEEIKKNEVVGHAHHSQGKSAEGIISSIAIGTKQKKMIQERDSVNIDQHLKVKEAILGEPHGAHTLALSVEDDKHIDEAIEKNERIGYGSHGTSEKGFAYSIQRNLLGAFGKGKKKMIQETEVINADEHSMLNEEIIAGGTHGEQSIRDQGERCVYSIRDHKD